MTSTISSGMDVIEYLTGQHDEIKVLFSLVNSSDGTAKQEAFYSLRRLLAVHETAEEEIVHPAARRAFPDDPSLVDARLLEENEAKKILSDLEDLDVDSPEFEEKFQLLQNGVLVHARAEEEQEFPLLADALDQGQLDKNARRGGACRKDGADAAAPWSGVCHG
jgi:hemerythrin superfamily protein